MTIQNNAIRPVLARPGTSSCCKPSEICTPDAIVGETSECPTCHVVFINDRGTWRWLNSLSPAERLKLTGRARLARITEASR